MDRDKTAQFQQMVWDFYRERGRHDLPWRVAEADGSFDAYKILVSEIMLQQTQVARVIPKYQEFLNKFPTAFSLAQASLGEVLAMWNGLGYNRRAKFLWQAARMVEQNFSGEFPYDVTGLQKLPGVGANTAGAIIAYAFNEPVTFIETNIRTVFIHHFFKDQESVSDKEILQWVAATLPDEEGKEQEQFCKAEGEFSSPAPSRKTVGLSRLWFWALMDYGSHLKQTAGNVNRASKSYVRQSKFEGSRRQIRGRIIRALVGRQLASAELESLIGDPRLSGVLHELLQESLIQKEGDMYALFD